MHMKSKLSHALAHVLPDENRGRHVHIQRADQAVLRDLDRFVDEIQELNRDAVLLLACTLKRGRDETQMQRARQSKRGRGAGLTEQDADFVWKLKLGQHRALRRLLQRQHRVSATTPRVNHEANTGHTRTQIHTRTRAQRTLRLSGAAGSCAAERV